MHRHKYDRDGCSYHTCINCLYEWETVIETNNEKYKPCENCASRNGKVNMCSFKLLQHKTVPVNYIYVNGKNYAENQFEYQVGEVIRLNNAPAKCVMKTYKDGIIIHHFIMGQVFFDVIDFKTGIPNRCKNCNHFKYFVCNRISKSEELGVCWMASTEGEY